VSEPVAETTVADEEGRKSAMRRVRRMKGRG